MLSQMARQLFAGSPFTVLPTFALGVFILVFFSIALRVMLRRSSSFDSEARLPLDDSEVGNDER